MKTCRRTSRSRSAAFTLIELMLAVALLGIALGSVAMMGMASTRAYGTGATASQLELQVSTTIERVVADLRTAVVETLAPDPAEVGSDEVTYVQATGMTDGEVEWSPVRRLRFEYEIGELDDGLDNNGNGLIDEGRVVLTENLGEPDQKRRTLTRWVRELADGEEDNGLDDNGNGLVDERGFSLERTGETLTVRLTLERRNAEGRLMSRVAQTSTRLRN